MRVRGRDGAGGFCMHASIKGIGLVSRYMQGLCWVVSSWHVGDRYVNRE